MDEIQRKLALIDEQLAGRNLHKRIIASSPLVFPALGLMIGIVIQNALSHQNQTGFGVWPWLVTLMVFSVGSVLFFVFYKTNPRPDLTAYCALVCFLCLGAIRLESFQRAKPNDIRNFVGNEPKLATIRGLVISEPYRENRQWQFSRFLYWDQACSFYLKLTQLKSPKGWVTLTGTVRVQIDEPTLDLRAGDYIQAYCWLERFKAPTNPGEFDIQKYLANKNIFIASSIGSRDAIELLQPHTAGIFLKFKRTLQEIAGRALLGELNIQGQEYALLQALTLGYRTNIDSRTYRAFQETGLLHFISLSGMNFAIVIGVVWWLCKTAGLMKPARALICLIASAVFLLVVPPQPPAIRAAIMSCVFCASFFFSRRSTPYNSLALAAIVLLLIRPTYLFEADWQLSFAAVLGILLFAPSLSNWMFERTADQFGKKNRPSLFLRILRKTIASVIAVFAVSLAAWLATAGIMLHHFCTFNYLTSIWTVLVSPLIAVVSVLGYAKILVAIVLPNTAAMLDWPVAWLSWLLIEIVRLIGSWNISQIRLGQMPYAIIFAYYALLLFALVPIRRQLAKKLICGVTAAAIIITLIAVKWNRTHRDYLTLTCLDIGHGQAILAQFPGRANILLDAGSSSRKDIGTRIVVPFLNRCGIDRLDAIIISHNDLDHINGIPEIVENFRVDTIYANDAFFTSLDERPTVKFLSQNLKAKGLDIKPFDEMPPFSTDIRLTTLWPNKQLLHDNQLSENDRSTVFCMDFAGVKILVCSDIEKRAQTEILRTYPELRADIVIAPHHGSPNTLNLDFLDTLTPHTVICSCGRIQRQSQEILTPPPNSKMLATVRDGAVTICITKDGRAETSTFGPDKGF